MRAGELCAQIWPGRLCTQKNSANKKILHAKFGGRLCMQENSANRKILRAKFGDSKENSADRKLLRAKFGWELCTQENYARKVWRVHNHARTNSTISKLLEY